MTHTARPGNDEPAISTIASIDAFEGLDWIEVPLDSAADRAAAHLVRPNRLAQLSVANHRPASRHGGVADLLREVAQRLDELDDGAIVHDITFARPGRPGAPTVPADDAHMTVYYEN